MYTFSSKLKTFSIALMIIGALGVAYGFFSAPSTVEDVKVMMQDSHDSHGVEASSHEPVTADAHGTTETQDVAHSDDAHAEHVLHLLQNKPWSALYVALFFFFMISLATLAFYAIQHASQAGWPVVLFRVMEAITAYLPVGGVLLFVFFVLSSMHMNHLFIWMDPEVVAHDELIQNKVGYLNVSFFLIRAAIYILGWVLYRNYARKVNIGTRQCNRFKKLL